jgi:Ser/Thr protein kinase RdoA (MazF antagonist)
VPGTPELLTELSKALRRGTAELEAHGAARGRSHHGVIHRDLSPENVVHRDGEAYPIDLDGCGTGAFLYDLALPLLRLSSHSDAAVLQDAVVDAYDEVRPLPPHAINLLRLNVAVRLVERLESLLRHRDASGQLAGPRRARAEETVRALHEVCAAAGLRPR